MRTLVASMICAIVLISTPALAETEGPHLGFSLQGGYATWLGDSTLKDDWVYGARLDLMPWKHLGVEGTFELNPTYDETGAFHRISHLSADLLVEILPFERFNPYVVGGYANFHDSNGQTNADGWEAGGGVFIRLLSANGRRMDLRLDGRYISTRIDVAGSGEEAPLAWFFTAGLRFSLGANSADGDQDGVPDRDDECPATPLGARVDARGCPSDGDGDGVYDGLDLCPDTPAGAMVDERGCSIDSDGDGVPDGLDRCPGTPRCVIVDEHGCPSDSDGDGVPDGVDLCPDTPEGVEVDENGCPLDSDGDGVPDYRDDCPDTPAGTQVGPDGCPISAREFELLDTGLLRMDTVHFASAKATITAASYVELAEVGEILVKWPDLRIEIGGHTDSQGTAEFNQKLSENRARAVLDWLLHEFPQIDANQYEIRGYGESQAVAGNDTPEGRARNRRVEFKVLNQELLRRDLSPEAGDKN